MMIRKSFAKINITLEILGKRNDGYHNISSLMQTIDLSDELTFAYSDTIKLRSNLRSMETDDNLIIKAASTLSKLTGYTRGADIYLNKKIPLSSGMGGGSSNGACTLLALNSLWGLNLSSNELLGICEDLGSDVSFFLGHGTALVQGKGNIIETVEHLPRLYFVIVTPDVEIHNKTSLLYSYVTTEMFTEGAFSREVVNRISHNLPLRGGDTCNVFSDIYHNIFPEIDWYRNNLMECGAEWVQFTGSGPSLYTFSEDEQLALDIINKLVHRGIRCTLSSTTSPGITDLI